MKRITKQEAIESFGQENVKAAISQGAEPTSRVMYPAFENLTISERQSTRESQSSWTRVS